MPVLRIESAPCRKQCIVAFTRIMAAQNSVVYLIYVIPKIPEKRFRVLHSQKDS